MRRGLFVSGTDTNVGKTYVAACLARELRAGGVAVGVYKPAASGCEAHGGAIVSSDAVALWEAAGRPGALDDVCPQRFRAPLAPHLAARAEGREIDRQLLRDGLNRWLDRSEWVIVEGAGGLLSPLGDDDFVADLAVDFQFPMLIVADNKLGAINQTLQTIFVARHYRGGVPVAGVVLNEAAANSGERAADQSRASNAAEIARHADLPLLATLEFGGQRFRRWPNDDDRPIRWREWLDAISVNPPLRSA
jgi:dethiobiotin synthetase